MARLQLVLSEEEVRAILDNDIVRVVDYESEPHYDEGCHRACIRISDCTPGEPFAVAVDEMGALLEAICEPTEERALSEHDQRVLLGIVAALDMATEP